MNEPVFTIVGTDHGQCPLDTQKKKSKKPLFVVTGAGYSGKICPEHLLILAQQQAKRE